MDFETISYETADHIGTLVLNRPDRANSVNWKMMEELNVALEAAAQDASLRVLIITGAGDKAFCGGGDIADEDMYAEWDMEKMRKWVRKTACAITERIRLMPVPTIAAINGIAVGGGFDWSCAADIRIGCEKTRFMPAQIKTALVPDSGACYLLPRIMRLDKALEILYTGDWITAEEAYDLGILTKLVSAESLTDETLALAQKIASSPPIVTRYVKQLVYRGLDSDLSTALEMTAAMTAMTMFTHDHEEGVAAWKEKRAPDYKGN